MFTTIRLDNLNQELGRSAKPVLIACIRRDFAFTDQIRILKHVARTHGENIKICLLDENCAGASRRLNIEGDPVFIGFYNGIETGRLFGRADVNSLNEFVSDAIRERKNRRLNA